MNRGPLVSEATDLPTEPQPLPKKHQLFALRSTHYHFTRHGVSNDPSVIVLDPFVALFPSSGGQGHSTQLLQDIVAECILLYSAQRMDVLQPDGCNQIGRNCRFTLNLYVRDVIRVIDNENITSTLDLPD